MSHWSERLPKDACREAVEWAQTQPDYETAWAVCERGDWMLWLVGRCDTSAPMSVERRRIVRCVVEIVETVRHLMPPPGGACLDLVTRWCDGAEVSESEIRAASAAAASASAAYAAAAYAAAAYAYAAAYADADAAIVRRHYPTPPVLP